MINQFPKLKTTSSFEKKLDAVRRIALDCFQFISKRAAKLRFSILFEIRIVRFFYTAGLCKRLPHQGCAKVGLIHKVFRQSGVRLLVETEGLSNSSGTFLFLKVLVSLFFVFKSKIQGDKIYGQATNGGRYRRFIEYQT